MPEPQLHNPAESIKATLDIFDPEHRGILIGTAAIHMFLSSRDLDSSRIPLRDVDLLASDEDLDVIQEGLKSETVESVTRMDRRLTIVPSEEAGRIGVCTLDAISDSDSYDDPLVHTRFNGRIYAGGALKPQLIKEANDVRYLSFPFICWWKMSVGRDSDKSTVHKATIALAEGRNVWSNELTELRLAIQRGEDGERFDGGFVYSEDPRERKEQLAEREPESEYEY